MKTTVTIIAFIGLIFTTIFAQWNYQDARKAATLSEGSDKAISDTMKVYGFDGDIFEHPNTIQKIKALINKH